METKNQVLTQMENFTKTVEQMKKELSKVQDKIKGVLENADNSLNELQKMREDTQKFAIGFQDVKRTFFKDFFENFNNFFYSIDVLQQEYENSKKVLFEYSGELIVLVYGMVKTGKSALGNFIAGVPVLNRMDLLDASEIYKNLNIKIEVWKDGVKTMEDRFIEFEEDVIEATNRIQIFRLGALTWVDTPGIRSMTKENERIAKKFTGNADLVLFLTSSEAPLRGQELDELKELERFKEKPWLICITKSDMYEWDADEKGNTIKILKAQPLKTRREQEEYVQKVLEEKGVGGTRVRREILSTSVKLAETALKSGDLEKFKESNIPKFYELLLDLLKEESYWLKLRTPLNRAKETLKTILEGNTEGSSLLSLKKELEKIKEDIESIENQLLQEGCRKIIRRIKSKAGKVFDEYVKKEEQKVLSGGKADTSFLERRLNEILSEEITDTVNKYLVKVVEKTAEFSVKLEINPENFSLTEKREKIKGRRKKYYKRERKDFWGKVVKIITLGFKCLYEPDFRTFEVEKEVTVGTNKAEVYESFMKFVEEKLSETVEEEIKKISAEYFSPIKKQIEEMMQVFETSQKSLEAQIKELRKEEEKIKERISGKDFYNKDY